MEQVNKSIRVNAPLERVLGVMADIEGYASFMPNIKEVRILETDLDRLHMRAEIVSRSSIMPTDLVSEQKIQFNFEERLMTFTQISGHLDFFEGIRRLQPEGEGVRFHSEVRFLYKKGMMGRMAGRAVRQVVEKNVDTLLSSVKERSESAPHDFLEIEELVNSLKKSLTVG